MAATRPSIISEGATISAPASTWLRAVLANSSRVLSLFTYPSASSWPQWPWLVYSHRQTSVVMKISLWLLISAMARCTMPSEAQAALPHSSWSSGAGMPNSIICSTPASSTSRIAAGNISTDQRYCPGIAAISCLTPRPSVTNIG